MAVVFIAPKQRQKMFFLGITIGVGVFLLIIAILVLFSQPKQVASELVFNKPKVNINFEIFNSSQFKNLEPFSEMEIQFYYKARKEGEEIEGYIASISIEEARKMLEDMDYSIIQLKEAEIGRENPFESYKTVPNLQENQNINLEEI